MTAARRGYRLPGRIEGLCLLGLAGFLVYLLGWGHYWMYLNPKFRPLSAACAAVLAGFGLLALARPPVSSGWFRAAAYVVALGLCAGSELSLRPGFDSGSLGTDPPTAPQEEAPLPSRVRLDGREYLRINLGELYDVAAKRQENLLGADFAVRGFVYRSPALDAAGEVIVFRVAMYCCFADATTVGFRLRPPKGEELPAQGQWLVVYGRLQEDPQPEEELTIAGSAFTSVQPDFVIAADKLEKTDPPNAGLGMMYEWRSQEPFAF